MKKLFRKIHKRTKAIRGRGTREQQELARLRYLRSLEREYDFIEAQIEKLLAIRRTLYEAWRAQNAGDDPRVIVMADQAQQAIHKLGKKIWRRTPRSIVG